MLARYSLLLLTVVHSGQSIFFGTGDCCSGGGSYGGYDYGSANYGYGGTSDYGNYGTQSFVQQPQPQVTSGKIIVRSKVYKPYIRRTVVYMIPQNGQVVKPYSTEFVPDQQSFVSTGSVGYSGGNYAPSYGSNYGSYGGYDNSGYGSNYGSNYGGYGSNYGSNYGSSNYGGFGGGMFG